MLDNQALCKGVLSKGELPLVFISPFDKKTHVPRLLASRALRLSAATATKPRPKRAVRRAPQKLITHLISASYIFYCLFIPWGGWSAPWDSAVKKIYKSYCLFENFMYICVVEWLMNCLTFQWSSINFLIINKMKGIIKKKVLKQFQITSLALPSCELVSDSVLSFNLRDAWFLFRKRYRKQFPRLLFQKAYTSERSYYKIY